VTFDPFGDFATHGYLRNFEGVKDPAIIKAIEHRSFLAHLPKALDRLSQIKELTYCDILETHRTLFGAVYPWAGQDRQEVAPDIAVSKGPVLFVHPNDIRAAAEYGLKLGQKPESMIRRPGEVMGYFAYAHPFLDGNGRTIMTVHADLAQRAGISIDWAATDKREYLAALTREIDQPGQGILDRYLMPFIRKAAARDQMASQIIKTPGLDGRKEQTPVDEVLGRFSDPHLKARYRQQKIQRGGPEL
jgi:cell filamentation protein